MSMEDLFFLFSFLWMTNGGVDMRIQESDDEEDYEDDEEEEDEEEE